MPIAHIIVAPDLAGAVTRQGAALTAAVQEVLTDGLGANPRLVQVMFTAALVPPAGCDVLVQVQHRASPARSAEVRAQAAQRLHDLLQQATGRTVRVRLIALEPEHIAAIDSPEALS